MRFKRVPPAPASLDRLDDARRAVALVPDPEADCCARLRDRLGLTDRDAGREWLTLLRALGLVERTDRGYRRTRDASTDPAALAPAFRERVYPVRELLAVVEAAGPVTAAEAFDPLADRVSTWERSRDPDWAATWRERVSRLLGWAALVGLAARTDAGYVRR